VSFASTTMSFGETLRLERSHCSPRSHPENSRLMLSPGSRVSSPSTGGGVSASSALSMTRKEARLPGNNRATCRRRTAIPEA